MVNNNHVKTLFNMSQKSIKRGKYCINKKTVAIMID